MNRQAFRTSEAVDIQDNANGFHVAWTKLGEYLRYTVDVETSGEVKKNAFTALSLFCIESPSGSGMTSFL